MTDELCAREGCGAPKAYHDLSTSIAELLRANDQRYELGDWPDGFRHNDVHVFSGALNDMACRGSDCHCRLYLRPEPPKPERKAYVVEMTDGEVAYRGSLGLSVYSSSAAGTRPRVTAFIPLADYLAAHPEARWPAYDDLPEEERAAFERVAAKLSEPAPLCICGGEVDDHDPVTGRCSHVAKRARIASVVGEDLTTWIEQIACQCPKFEAQP